MNEIHIYGGVEVQGKVKIQGSKNAALPILAAVILTKGKSIIRNCPKISDVYQMLHILKSIGCEIKWEGNSLSIHADALNHNSLPEDAIVGMRSSLCLLGAMLGRTGQITMEYPGGCVIGERPIDLHLMSLECLGVVFHEDGKRIWGNVKQLKGNEIYLSFPSVGATENIILAAVMADGITTVSGAACEPEVEALCEYLVQCGAKIEGIGTSNLIIRGGSTLQGTDFTIPADRIVAGTYLFACIAAGGSVFLEAAPCSQMEAVIKIAEQMGAECQETEEGLYVCVGEEPKSIGTLETDIYPGFPTDLQSIVLAVCTCTEGKTFVNEKIFENRFRIVESLLAMGAEIESINKQSVMVQGVSYLKGTIVEAKELRGGAALVLAGMMAEGETVIKECHYIGRGYENICKDLRELGVRIYCV